MTNFSEDDEVINVQMPKGDYKVLREMIKDRRISLGYGRNLLHSL
jgi:hypothetical protein